MAPKRKPKPKGKAKAKPIRAPAPEHPWDRQPNESAVAYAAFRTYLLEGAARSTTKVARACGKHKSLMDRWSAAHRWVARVDAFEAEAAKRQDEAILDELEARGRRQAELAVTTLEAMAAPSLELMRRIEKDPDVLRKLDLDRLVPLAATTARAIPRVVQTERLARGQSTTNVGGHRGGPLEIEGEKGRSAAARAAAEQRVADMPDEALEAFLAGAETQRKLAQKSSGKART
jgi:hypothetical protein